MKQIYKVAIKAAIDAGNEIMKIYQKEDLQVINKEDNSPLTIADRESNKIINAALLPTGIPLISEENDQVPFEERKKWEECWIVDPLDGTKEFIKRNGEFTVNIAFVKNGAPKFGVIYAPALNLLYYGDVSEKKAFKATISETKADVGDILHNSEEIHPDLVAKKLRIVGSRSHMNEETKTYIQDLKLNKSKEIEIVPKGSSLKFCLVAEGEANIYPRFGPTMEWDTAAGQAICEAVGLRCIFSDTKKTMTYNRENLLNANFIVSHEG